MTFEDDGIKRAEIIPLNVFNEEVAFQPRVLNDEAAEAVINEVRTLSEKWHTKLTMEGNLGVIQIKP